jgi:hypothetical protein
MLGSAAGKMKWPLRVQTGGKEGLIAHDLVRKPVPTFRDHALSSLGGGFLYHNATANMSAVKL